MSTHANGIGHPAGTTTKKGPCSVRHDHPDQRREVSTGLASAPAGVKSTIDARLAGLYGVPTGADHLLLIGDGALWLAALRRGGFQPYDLFRPVCRHRNAIRRDEHLSESARPAEQKFVMGDDTDTSVGEKGGTSSHTHTATVSVEATTLTADQMPRHLHGYGIRQDGPSRSGRRLLGVSVGVKSGGFQTDYAGASQSHAHTATSTPDSTCDPPSVHRSRLHYKDLKHDETHRNHSHPTPKSSSTARRSSLPTLQTLLDKIELGIRAVQIEGDAAEVEYHDLLQIELPTSTPFPPLRR